MGEGEEGPNLADIYITGPVLHRCNDWIDVEMRVKMPATMKWLSVTGGGGDGGGVCKSEVCGEEEGDE